MRPHCLLAVPAGIVLALAVPVTATPAAAATSVEVTFDRVSQATALGDRFTVRARIANLGTATTEPLMADLNVTSVTTAVYVDLEDWSADRTHELPPLEPGASTTLSFDLQPVNVGRFNVYVVVLPNGASSPGTGPLAVSPAVHVTVAGRTTLSAGGALPVAIAVPVLLGVALAVTRIRLRRTG
jgi:CARDB protein